MNRIQENALDLNDAKMMRAWLGRLLDMPASFFSDDSLEDLRFDIAHYFLMDDMPWTSAMVVAGDLTPYQHGKRAEALELCTFVENVRKTTPQIDKVAFTALMRPHFDKLNLEVPRCVE